jgi:hypothetical protein
VTAVAWRELPHDAPEPPPLPVVRAGVSGQRWLRGEGDDWELLDGEHAGGVNGWGWVSRLVPVRLGQPAQTDDERRRQLAEDLRVLDRQRRI